MLDELAKCNWTLVCWPQLRYFVISRYEEAGGGGEEGAFCVRKIPAHTRAWAPLGIEILLAIARPIGDPNLDKVHWDKFNTGMLSVGQGRT